MNSVTQEFVFIADRKPGMLVKRLEKSLERA
jgi:hypothetical protein